MSEPDRTQAAQRAQLIAELESLGITPQIVPYPAHATIDEGQAPARRYARSAHQEPAASGKTKTVFFITAHDDSEIDLRTLHTD